MSLDKGRVAWAACVGAFIASLMLFALVALGMRFEPLPFFILMVFIMTVWLVGMIATTTFSEEGWVVKGSRGEWIAAFLVNPVFALMLSHLSEHSEESDFIDPDDEERIRRL
ncbi:MAG: hypothetical protein QXJ32_00410 [Thermoplasmata archaeon]